MIIGAHSIIYSKMQRPIARFCATLTCVSRLELRTLCLFDRRRGARIFFVDRRDTRCGVLAQRGTDVRMDAFGGGAGAGGIGGGEQQEETFVGPGDPVFPANCAV